MTPRSTSSASPKDLEFLSKVAAYWRSKELQPNSPTEFGRFVVKETLGQGGFGIVYRAYDPLLGRDLAIKVPGLQSLSDASRLKRFLSEAKFLGSFSHPNIAEIYEADEVDGLCYIAMKYYPDGTLADWFKLQNSPIPPRIALELFEGVVAGVAAAHSVGIVHRDLKPSNILLAVNGRDILPCVADFGLAKHHSVDDQSFSLASFARIGTAEYIAPENFVNHPSANQPSSSQASATQAGDVFALGVILFELLMGRKPILYSSIVQSAMTLAVSDVELERRLHDEIRALIRTRSDVSLALIEVVSKCLKFNALERYPNANELLLDLQRVPTEETGRFTRSSRFKRLTYSIAIITTLGMTIWGVASYRSQKVNGAPAPIVEAKPNTIEGLKSYAIEIQAAFDRRTSDSSVSRKRAVDRALGHLSTKSVPFESAFLRSLGDTNRVFPLNHGRSNWIPCVRVSADNKWLAVNGPMQDLLLFDLTYPQTIRRYQGLRDGAFRLAISPTNKYLVGITSIYKRPDRTAPQVLLWDFESAKMLMDVNDYLGLVNLITCEFISDNQILLSGAYRNGDFLKVFSIDSRTVEQTLPLSPLSPDKGRYAENLRFQISGKVRTPSEPSKYFFLDKQDQFESTLELEHDTVAIAISDTGLVAFVGGVRDSSSTSTIETLPPKDQIVVWNPRTQQELFRESQEDSIPVTAITFSSDSRSIYFVNGESNVFHRNLEKPRIEITTDATAPRETWCVTAHPNERKLLYCGDDGWVGLQKVPHHRDRQQADENDAGSKWPLHDEMLVTQCSWRPQHVDQFATSSFDGTVRLWRLSGDKPQLVSELPHPSRVRCIAFTLDGSRIATGCDDHKIRVFDVDSTELVSTLTEHKEKLRSLTYSTDAKQLFSSANDSTLVTWDLTQGQPRSVEHLTTNAICSTVSPNGKWFVFGTQAGVLGIRPLTGEGEAKDISVSKQWLRCLAITHDSQTLATGTEDGDITLWNLETGIKLAAFSKQPSPIMSLTFSGDDRTLTAALYSGQLIHWTASSDLSNNESRRLRH